MATYKVEFYEVSQNRKENKKILRKIIKDYTAQNRSKLSN